MWKIQKAKGRWWLIDWDSPWDMWFTLGGFVNYIGPGKAWHFSTHAEAVEMLDWIHGNYDMYQEGWMP